MPTFLACHLVSHSPNMASFRLQDLPGELRNNIYKKFPLSDKMTMMTTCRSINDEVSPFFYQEAIYRTSINVHHPTPYTNPQMAGPPPQHIKDKIQNIEVHWFVDGASEKAKSDIEAFSWDPPIRRGTCRVLFGWCQYVYPHRTSSPGLLDYNFLEPLKTLAGFRTLEIRVGTLFLRMQNILLALKRPVWNCRCFRILHKCEIIARGLKPELGVAELQHDQHGDYLRFQPYRNSAATA